MSKDNVKDDYLKNKNKGGENNYKGNRYEDSYAIFQIITQIATKPKELMSISFQTQVKNAYVDDFLIENKEHRTYHQIKNQQHISWGSEEKEKTIAYDFVMQKEKSLAEDEAFHLKLVHSDAENDLSEKIPLQLKSCTTVEFFEDKENLNGYVLSENAFHENLKMIAADDKSDDNLMNIAMAFLGVWKSCNPMNKVTLLDIIERVKNIKPINLVIEENISIGEECRKILTSIQGLSYYIKGKMVYWNFGNFKGSCLWSEDIEQQIIQKKPQNKFEILSIL